MYSELHNTLQRPIVWQLCGPHAFKMTSETLADTQRGSEAHFCLFGAFWTSYKIQSWTHTKKAWFTWNHTSTNHQAEKDNAEPADYCFLISMLLTTGSPAALDRVISLQTEQLNKTALVLMLSIQGDHACAHQFTHAHTYMFPYVFKTYTVYVSLSVYVQILFIEKCFTCVSVLLQSHKEHYL